MVYNWPTFVLIVRSSGLGIDAKTKIEEALTARQKRIYRKLQRITRIDRPPLPITRRTGDW